jgi:3-oxoacyl-[acyl-carrier-protein] synthase III
MSRFFDLCGTQVRYKQQPGSRALDYVLEAARGAIDSAGVPPQEIDLLIYCGVGRGFLEPATANVVQAELGLSRATCFDILDACAGWLRAVQVAHSFLARGAYRCALIVNCECSLESFLHYDVEDRDDFERRLAAFTIGEAATATVVRAGEEPDDFYFLFKTYGEHYALCMIPLPNAMDYLPAGADNHHVANKFYSRSREIITASVKKIVEHFHADEHLRQWDYDIAFPHAASEAASQLVCRQLGVGADRYFGIHAQYGNTVSASVPLAMSLAIESGRLRRGDKVLVVIGSAGMSVGFATFTF